VPVTHTTGDIADLEFGTRATLRHSPSPVKHAQAERAEVTARVEDGMVRVEVRDDSVGDADPSGHGLMRLSDRVTAIGGQLVVESPLTGGTLLTVRLPVSAQPAPTL
jgi:glucose-6-phosphate-specific signal transduction histidine kinase